MLKKFQREKEKERQKSLNVNQRSPAITGEPTIPLCPADAGGGGGSGLTEPLLSLIGSTNDHALIQAATAVDFDIDLDSLLEDSEGLSSKSVPQQATGAPLLQPKTDSHAQSDATHTEAQTSVTQAQCFPLPDGLPVGLEDSIQKLMVVSLYLRCEMLSCTC